MRLPKVRYYNYKSDVRSWAVVVSFTASNITLQLGPFFLYVGWSPIDYTF